MNNQSNRDHSALTGPRVRLVELDEIHLPAVQRWRSDPEVTRYWISQDIPAIEDLQRWLQGNKNAGSITLAIFDENGAAIGYTDVFAIEHEHRRCEISLMIGERASWGRGYAKEALSVLLDYLFRSSEDSGKGMHKVSLAVFAENHAARRVYQACGFHEDGTLRDDMYRDGKWHDQILMSILEDEFRQSRHTG